MSNFFLFLSTVTVDDADTDSTEEEVVVGAEIVWMDRLTELVVISDVEAMLGSATVTVELRSNTVCLWIMLLLLLLLLLEFILLLSSHSSIEQVP